MAKRGRDYGIDGESEKSKAMSTQRLRMAAARDFQKMIRLEAVDERGKLACVTCGDEFPYNVNKVDAGHFVSGRTNGVLFDERNCHPQCKACNLKRGGAPIEYAEFMASEYGKDVIEELLAARHTPLVIYRYQLLEMRDEYRARIKAAEKRISGRATGSK